MRARTVLTVFTVLAAVAMAMPAAAQVEDYRDITYPPLPAFEIPQPQVYTLPNGMTVLLLEDHELPLITAIARIRTGSNYEPADKTGLADIMATVQRSGGTATMSGDDLDDFLAARAAEIETGMGSDFGAASMNCLKGTFDDVFAVFSDVLRHPAFSEDKIEIAKLQANTGIARRNDNIGGITAREFRRLVYGPDSPQGRLEEYATVAAVGRDDLVAWHQRFYHPNNVYLGIVGDFDPAAMKKKIAATFGDWEKGPSFTIPEMSYPTVADKGVFLVEKTDVNQSNIVMGHLGMEITDPDYFAARVMNEVLGGSFASRLFSNIRTKKGLAYSVYGGLGAGFTVPGVFQVGLQTKSESTVDAINALKAEVQGIIDTPPTDEEMARAKEAILNSFIFNYDSNSKILRQQLTYAFYGLPSDFLEQYRSNIEKVTSADVVRAAKRYVHPGEMAILVVGNPSEFGTPLSEVGKVKTLDITIPPPPDRTAKVEKTEAGVEMGAKLLAKVADTLGGPGRDQVEAISSSSSMVMSMGGQSMTLQQSVLVVFPDAIRQEIQTPMGNQVVVINGDEGFMTMGGQVRPLPAPAVQEQQKQLARDLRFIVRYADDPDTEAVAGGEDEVGGTPCTTLAVTLHGTSSQLCVAEDGTVLKQTFQGKNPMTQVPGQVEVTFSDYKEMDGRMVPQKSVVSFDGQKFSELTLKSFEVNPVVDMALFAKPAA